MCECLGVSLKYPSAQSASSMAGASGHNLWMVSGVTFRPKAVRPDRVLPEFERLYVRLCRMLVSNPHRPGKRRLLPFALPPLRQRLAPGRPRLRREGPILSGLDGIDGRSFHGLVGRA